MKFLGSYKAARALCKKRNIPVHAHVFTKGEVHLMVTVPTTLTLVRGEESVTLQPGPRVLRVTKPYPTPQGAS